VGLPTFLLVLRELAHLHGGWLALEPRVEIKGAIAGGVEVAVFMLQPGEDEVVGRRLRDALRKA